MLLLLLLVVVRVLPVLQLPRKVACPAAAAVGAARAPARALPPLLLEQSVPVHV